MNKFQYNEIDVAIVAGTVMFLLLAGFITAYITVYWKRKQKHQQEVQEMKTAFEKTLLQSQLEIQEQTFHTISQEIHDNVGQTLSLAKVQANIIDQSETTDKQLLAEVRQNIGKAMSDLRDLAKSLNSDHVQLVPLKDLIATELLRMQRSNIVATEIAEEGVPQPIAHQKKLILFRIVQESLQNILKHAEAALVTVHLNYLNDFVEIKIVDNGKGFDANTIPKNDGLGLQNITNRAALIGGKAAIQSSPGEGTTITLNIPYA